MPKVVDHDQRRSDIIDATWSLIVRGGLEATTMRDIAAAAGFANGALKHYFSGKAEIVEGAYYKALRQVSERARQRTEAVTGVAALRAWCQATIPVDREDWEAARVLLSFWELGRSSEPEGKLYQTHLKAWREELIDLIAQARAAGEVTSALDDDQLADELVLLNIGATAMVVVAPHQASPELFERLLDSFFARL